MAMLKGIKERRRQHSIKDVHSMYAVRRFICQLAQVQLLRGDGMSLMLYAVQISE